MRFKEFIDIDSLRHAKIDEKPVKNYEAIIKNYLLQNLPLMVVIKHIKN